MITGYKMKIRITIYMISLASAFIISPLQADNGKSLYEEKCTKCHTTEVFTKEDRSIKSLEGLKNRVQQCTGAAEVTWSDDQIKSVTDYLNKHYYKF